MSFVIIVRNWLGSLRKKHYLCRQIKKRRTMNSKILKLDAPYNVIYAGGKIGRHIATLITWDDAPDGGAEVMEARQYPIIDQGEEFPAGTLVTDAELEDCRTLCTISTKTGLTGINLYWVAKIIEYDFQQLEPAGAEYILERMKLLDCVVKLPETEIKDEDGHVVKDEDGNPEMRVIYEYQASLNIFPSKGGWDKNEEYVVKSNRYCGFYFESSGTEDEIYNDLEYQLSVYRSMLLDDIGSIEFSTGDGLLSNVINRLNKSQGIETNYIDVI